jgi:hypothetical protein
MHVIGKNNVSANQPMSRFTPPSSEDVVRSRIGEDGPTIFRANSEKYGNPAIESIHRFVVDWMASACVWQ